MAGHVRVDESLCLGNGLCVELAPDHFELDGSERSVVKGEPNEEHVWQAIRACPTQAIYLAD